MQVLLCVEGNSILKWTGIIFTSPCFSGRSSTWALSVHVLKRISFFFFSPRFVVHFTTARATAEFAQYAGQAHRIWHYRKSSWWVSVCGNPRVIRVQCNQKLEHMAAAGAHWRQCDIEPSILSEIHPKERLTLSEFSGLVYMFKKHASILHFNCGSYWHYPSVPRIFGIVHKTDRIWLDNNCSVYLNCPNGRLLTFICFRHKRS